jgi:thiol:disulfide interchange protein DsbC|tara:strand:+ start:166 stop:921 length:756 start_codon:yes stop_codon:yes gene_type:complete
MLLIITKLAATCALALALLAPNVGAGEYTELESSLARINPDMKAVNIATTPMFGIYDVLLNTGDRLYMSADGDFFFAGTMYQNRYGEGLVNLTEQGAIKSRLAAMQTPQAQQTWVFPAVGEKKATISVFTDVDCYYCQKLHLEIADINALGIEVRYLAFPRAGLGSPSYQVLVDAWCAENTNEYLTEAKLRSHNKQARQKSPKACENPVMAHYNLGQEIGVNGTPAIVFESGELLPGYLPANELAKRLDLL